MEDLAFFQAALDDPEFTEEIDKNAPPKPNEKKIIKPKKTQSKSNYSQNESKLIERTKLLSGVKEEYQLVEINRGLRDALLDSMATMADLENPTIEESLNQDVKDALENLKKKLKVTRKKGAKKATNS